MTDITDVARLADVSVTTVSRVLNNHPSVRARTRKIVFAAMEQLGYLPHAGARNLRLSQPSTIGFVTTDLSIPSTLDTVVGASREIRDRGYSLLLCDSERDPAIESANLRRMLEMRVGGLIAGLVGGFSPELELFVRSGIPVVALAFHAKSPGVTRLYFDQRQQLRVGLEYLRDLGHKRVGFLTLEMPPYDSQHDAYRELLSELGLEYDSSLVALVASDAESHGAVERILSMAEPPTALISGRHTFAPYITEVAHSHGLVIPRDISFLNFGDSAWAKMANPPLTVVTRDYERSGHIAAEYLFRRIAGEDEVARLESPPAELIVRESCAPLPCSDPRFRAT